MKISARYTSQTRNYILIVSIIAIVVNYFFCISVDVPEPDYDTSEFFQEYPMLDMIRVYTSKGLYWCFAIMPFIGLVIVLLYKPTPKPDRKFRRTQ